MNICVTVNSKYMRYLYIMLVSLYENNKNGDIDLYVIQRDFTDDDKKTINEISNFYENRVHYIWADESKFDNFPIFKGGRTNLSLEIYLRLLLPEYLPTDIERVLMLDVDIVVNDSLEELYTLDFEGKMLAAAPNMCHNCIVKDDWRRWYYSDRTNWTHYNTGVLLWNLKGIREKYPREYIFNQAWHEKIETATFEEELFNVLFGDTEIKEIAAEKWNYISTHAYMYSRPNYKVYHTNQEIIDNCKILHFAALNPWQAGAKDETFDIWWNYAKRTPYYRDIISEIYPETERILTKQTKILCYADIILSPHCKEHMSKIFKKHDYHKIVLYGGGRIAKFITVMMNDECSIEAYIDKAYTGTLFSKPVLGIEDFRKSNIGADCILVTAPYYFNEIYDELSKITDIPIVNLDTILSEEC